ncbi:MAG: hypothetical protein K1X55_17515 [Chitinophagales bacterium]|nr:hypothetical protein [Chitinophagales bacterium]
METIFTHNLTKEEVLEILSEEVSESEYIDSMIHIEHPPGAYLILCDLEQLFSMRNDVINEKRVREKINADYEDLTSQLFNE